MKAMQYEIEITDSVLDFVHGHSQLIDEIYVPELNICYNVTQSDDFAEAHVFKKSPSYDRYKDAKLVREFEIDDSLAKRLRDFVDMRIFLIEEFHKHIQ